MITRILRLVRTELAKIAAQRFFLFSLPALALLVPLWELWTPAFSGEDETAWRGLHTIQLFAYGIRPGYRIASLLVVIFASLLFAGEFDRGTVKLLLTRPVTRSEVFTAKTIACLLLCLLYLGIVLLMSLLPALALGELGPVWDTETYIVKSSETEIVSHACTAALLLLLPLLAAAALGLMISAWTESSSHAVAFALVLFLVLEFISSSGLLSHDLSRWLFPHPPGYALDVLSGFAEGKSAVWTHRLDGWLSPWFGPLITGFLCVGAAFLRFSRRDVMA